MDVRAIGSLAAVPVLGWLLMLAAPVQAAPITSALAPPQLAGPAADAADVLPRASGSAALVSPLAIALPDYEPAPGITSAPGSARSKFAPALSPERAKILLRSLTVPGWGQATMGHKTSAWIFGVAEMGIWTSFTAFKVQERMRRDSYERQAQLFAGIDLDGRDEEFRRIVGSFLSSEEYNRLVVFRDAANLYYDDPDAYRRYIAEHELKGVDEWSWQDIDAILRYRAQRQKETRASNRANTVLAIAIGNRILSAIHAARFAGAPAKEATGWQLDVRPGDEPGDFRVGLHSRF